MFVRMTQIIPVVEIEIIPCSLDTIDLPAATELPPHMQMCYSIKHGFERYSIKQLTNIVYSIISVRKMIYWCWIKRNYGYDKKHVFLFGHHIGCFDLIEILRNHIGIPPKFVYISGFWRNTFYLVSLIFDNTIVHAPLYTDPCDIDRLLDVLIDNKQKIYIIHVHNLNNTLSDNLTIDSHVIINSKIPPSALWIINSSNKNGSIQNKNRNKLKSMYIL